MNTLLCDELFDVTRAPSKDSWSDSFTSNVLNDENLEKTSKISSEAIHSFVSEEDWHPNMDCCRSSKGLMSNIYVISNMECTENHNPSVQGSASGNLDSFVDDDMFKEHHIQELGVGLDGMSWDVNTDLEPMEFQRRKLDGESHSIPLYHTEDPITHSHYSHIEEPHSLSLTNNSNNHPQKIANVHGNDLPKFDRQPLIKKCKGKGQPAKNLMAERRRRRRLKDRLSMLRSILPNITQMDKTSIVSDTIDYAKRLMEQVRRLYKELEPSTPWPLPLSLYEHLSRQPAISSQLTLEVDSTPTVESEKTDFKVLMKCQGNSNMLLSTVTTLELLGLDMRDGKFSCFEDFCFKIICSHDLQSKKHLNADAIHLALAQTTGCTLPFKP